MSKLNKKRLLVVFIIILIIIIIAIIKWLFFQTPTDELLVERLRSLGYLS